MDQSRQPATPLRPEIPRRRVDIPGMGPRRRETAPEPEPEGKKLIVGRDISLSGEITTCDKLVVEGRVEASLTDSRVIEVAETGFFKGNVEVDEADISGRFEGKLTARSRLVIRATGRVRGTIRYGQIEIELGGEVSGDVKTVQGGRGAQAEPAPAQTGEPSAAPSAIGEPGAAQAAAPGGGGAHAGREPG